MGSRDLFIDEAHTALGNWAYSRYFFLHAAYSALWHLSNSLVVLMNLSLTEVWFISKSWPKLKIYPKSLSSKKKPKTSEKVKIIIILTVVIIIILAILKGVGEFFSFYFQIFGWIMKRFKEFRMCFKSMAKSWQILNSQKGPKLNS